MQVLVFKQWGFDRKRTGRGLSALFARAPAPAKTMICSLLAKEAGARAPARIDLSQVVSKYIRRFEKEPRPGVRRGRARQVMLLLFDEADSLFAKRAEVRSSNDHSHASFEVNYPLQRLRARGASSSRPPTARTRSPGDAPPASSSVAVPRADKRGRHSAPGCGRAWCPQGGEIRRRRQAVRVLANPVPARRRLNVMNALLRAAARNPCRRRTDPPATPGPRRIRFSTRGWDSWHDRAYVAHHEVRRARSRVPGERLAPLPLLEAEQMIRAARSRTAVERLMATCSIPRVARCPRSTTSWPRGPPARRCCARAGPGAMVPLFRRPGRGAGRAGAGARRRPAAGAGQVAVVAARRRADRRHRRGDGAEPPAPGAGRAARARPDEATVHQALLQAGARAGVGAAPARHRRRRGHHRRAGAAARSRLAAAAPGSAGHRAPGRSAAAAPSRASGCASTRRRSSAARSTPIKDATAPTGFAAQLAAIDQSAGRGGPRADEAAPRLGARRVRGPRAGRGGAERGRGFTEWTRDGAAAVGRAAAPCRRSSTASCRPTPRRSPSW
ncbi:MAG: AAA family ATPase [Myxococcales bacterium]|nr:AAA family ATPase [Myxococcales bacterium]